MRYTNVNLNNLILNMTCIVWKGGKITMSYVFIDVREPSEYADGYVEGAINIPP